MKQNSLKAIGEGLREHQETIENRFIDDERAMDEIRWATILKRKDIVEKYLKENLLECKNCQDYLEESCKLLRVDRYLDDSECKEAGLKIEGSFDEDYNFKFKIVKMDK